MTTSDSSEHPLVHPVMVDIPGLFNVVDPVTRHEYRDLTIRQVESLAADKGWRLGAPDVQF